METTTSEEYKIETHNYYPNCDLTIWLRNCHVEALNCIEGQATFGKIPCWLNGVLVQNGPGGTNIYGKKDFCSHNKTDSNSLEKDTNCCAHLFDGPGLLQKYHFSNGRVTYMNRFIQTKSHKRNTIAGRLVVNEFGSIVSTFDPCNTIFQRISTIFTNQLDQMFTDTANISVHRFGDEIYSLAETPFAHRIELENLETRNTVNVNSEIGIINHTSHPQTDSRNGKMYNIGQKIDLKNGPHYVIVELDTNSSTTNEIDHSNSNNSSQKSPWSRAKILACIPSRWLFNICYMHSFSLTENYFILIEQPLSILVPEIPINYILGRKKSVASCLKYFPEQDTLFHVIPRDNTSQKPQRRKQTFRSSSFFFLHTINAFEKTTLAESEPSTTLITIDICCYDDPKMLDCMYIDALKDAQSNPDFAKLFRGRPKRFRLLLNDMNVQEKLVGETLVDFGCETPQIHHARCNGKEYTFFYAISSDVDLAHPGLLVKVDTEMKTWKTWGELKSYPSEPIFVPLSDGKAEDDGIILSSLLYGGEPTTGPNKMSVVILDARKWELMTKIDFPNTELVIPKCLHGCWFDDQKRLYEEGQGQQKLFT